MAVQLIHCGKSTSRTTTQSTITQVYSGTSDQIDVFISTLNINYFYTGKGYLKKYQKNQKGGTIYQCQCQYETSYDTSGTSEDSGSGEQYATLDGSMLSLPIQGHVNYLTCWNYYLIGLGDYADTVPEFWNTATETYIADRQQLKVYRWVKSLSEIPTDAEENGEYWQVVTGCKPIKAGVETYDQAVYIVTECSQYSDSTKAGWATTNKLNTITSPSETFGITSGNWKVDNASISFNGEKWQTRLTYTLSGDASGWDTDIYGDDQD